MAERSRGPILVIGADGVRVAAALAARGLRVTVASGPEDAERLAGRVGPALLVLRLGGRGCGLIARLRAGAIAGLDPRLPALAVVAAHDRRAAVAAFAAGADDVLAGPWRGAELCLRAERLLRPPRRPPIRLGSLEIDADAGTVTVDGARAALSRRERELLLRLASAPGRLFTKPELLRDVCGRDARATSRTLDRHVRSLRAKLGATGPLVVGVWGVGYRLDDV